MVLYNKISVAFFIITVIIIGTRLPTPLFSCIPEGDFFVENSRKYITKIFSAHLNNKQKYAKLKLGINVRMEVNALKTNLEDLLKIKSNGKSKYFYNIMPIENIPSVIENGILSYNNAKLYKHTSVALEGVQNRRERVKIPNGGYLHSYANLYFTYHNPMLYKRKDEADSICILAVSPRVLNIEGCILSDQNASTDLVKFYTPEDGLENIDFNMVFAQNWTDTNPYTNRLKKATKCAEILIPNCVPYDYILGAYVVSEESADSLRQTGFDKKIVVNSKVFYR